LAYSEIDFETFEFLLCRQVDKVVAVAVWGEHGLHYGPDGESSALLHGLYVDGHHQHAGTGTLLQTWLLARAATMGCEGIVVKAQRVSRGYFERSGYTRLPVGETGGTYPYRFWMRCTVTNTRGDECANVHRR
jgi:GNAT superfamily N-acetyltransferase